MCMCSHAVLIQAEVRDLQERLVIEKEAWEGNYMKKQVCVFVRNGCSFLLVQCTSVVCVCVCGVCMRACVCVHAQLLFLLSRRPPCLLRRGNCGKNCDWKETK